MRIVFNKIINAFLALYGVASLVFFLFAVLPGDSAQMMLDQKEDQELI
jgi:ABC-type dipeptide/oligopeptide/nickel transport system permease component